MRKGLKRGMRTFEVAVTRIIIIRQKAPDQLGDLIDFLDTLVSLHFALYTYLGFYTLAEDAMRFSIVSREADVVF